MKNIGQLTSAFRTKVWFGLVTPSEGQNTMNEAAGFCDLHCHLLYNLDDGAKTLEDSLAMGRLLVDLGFSAAAPSPHNRPEYASLKEALHRLNDVQIAFNSAGIDLKLVKNSENFFLDELLIGNLCSDRARLINAGPYLLVEAPYFSPLPALNDLIFRMRLKGITPLIAHPERCFEFERKGRAAEAVAAGALLQLDIGALVGRYGPTAKKLAQRWLDEELYAVGATDLHSPRGAEKWVAPSMDALRKQVGERRMRSLMADRPHRIILGQPLESSRD